MFNLTHLARAGTLAACIAVSGTIAVPAVALADTASTAAIVTAVGAIVGTLIYDSGHRQYYYVRGGRRYYVANDTAQQWYRRRDPRYFDAHRDDFRNNPQRFDRQYRGSHHPPV
jgi:hypothetical protein